MNILYLIFYDFQRQNRGLTKPRNNVNIMSQVFVLQLDLKIQKTNIGIQIIDNIILEIYKIIVFTFSILDKDYKKRFFEENFLLANIKSDIVFKILFLTISNASINF